MAWYRTEWKLDEAAEVLESTVSEATETEPFEEDVVQRWRYSRVLGLYRCQVDTDLESGDVVFTVKPSTVLQYVVYSLLAVTVVNLLLRVSPFISLTTSTFLSLALVAPGTQNFDIDHLVELKQEKRTSLLGVSVVLFLVSVWFFFRPVFPAVFVDVGVMLAAGLTLYPLYQMNAFPGQGIGSGHPLSSIPVTAITAVFFSFLLFFFGSISVAPSSSDSELFPVLGFVLLTLIYTAVFFVLSRKAVLELATQRVQPFRTRTRQAAALLLYIGLSVILAIGVFVAVLYPFYSATGAVPLFPDSVFQPVDTALNQLDSLYNPLPGPARIYTTVYLALPLIPVLVIGFSGVVHLAKSLAGPIYLYAVRDDVEIRTLSEGYKVRLLTVESSSKMVKPMTLLFGLIQFVVVSDSLRSELDEDEFEAVISHEYYHLENRDLLVNTVATLTSLLFGGRNTLLVFYDYPRHELEADRFAARLTSVDAVVSVIRTLEDYRRPDPSYLASPYQLFFGSVLLDAAHQDPDTRIRKLTENTRNFDSCDG